MQVPVFQMIRSGLHVPTRKLVTEVLVSSLATLLVMAMFSNLVKPTAPAARLDAPVSGSAGGLAASGTNEATADFMERVALSHVGHKPAAANEAIVAPSEPVVAAVAALAQRPAVAPRHDRPHAVVTHVAANVPDVLPPPRPPLARVEPAVPSASVAVTAPVTTKPLRPLQYGMRFVTQFVDFVPASGTRVVEGVTSMGDALTSFAKKL